MIQRGRTPLQVAMERGEGEVASELRRAVEAAKKQVGPLH
jgi:hypothetical protein